MWNPESQGKRPVSQVTVPAFGCLMPARAAVKDLRRAGVLGRKDARKVKAWLDQGCPPVVKGSTLDLAIWAVWMWQMMPASFADH